MGDRMIRTTGLHGVSFSDGRVNFCSSKFSCEGETNTPKSDIYCPRTSGSDKELYITMNAVNSGAIDERIEQELSSLPTYLSSGDELVKLASENDSPAAKAMIEAEKKAEKCKRAFEDASVSLAKRCIETDETKLEEAALVKRGTEYGAAVREFKESGNEFFNSTRINQIISRDLFEKTLLRSRCLNF